MRDPYALLEPVKFRQALKFVIDFANACLSLRRLGNICLPERDWLLRRPKSATLNAFPLESSDINTQSVV